MTNPKPDPKPLIDAQALQGLLQDAAADVLVLDCSFDLTDPQAGRRAHDAGHVPGSLYVSLDDTLSSAKTGRNGRHPLPTRAAFAQAMAALGAGDSTFVVAYDNAGGMYAARLWWMLRWAGHTQVAVLDGGLAAWQAAGGALSTQTSAPRPAGGFTLRESQVASVDYAQVLANIESRERLVVDARANDRYRGENETLDPVAGHIPGALNRLFRNNLVADGRFKPAETLRAEWQALIGERPASQVINQCGSGVTACHNLLAMEVAGLRGAALYPGSWSEWCAQPGAPVATGPQP
jgi:thiosulfate/3-mercaptopyruvate sulfurtransferase